MSLNVSASASGSRFFRVSIEKAELLSAAGNPLSAAHLINDLLAVMPESRGLQSRRATYLTGALKGAEELGEKGFLNDAAGILLGILGIDHTVEAAFIGINNLLVRQIWLDQKRLVSRDAYQLGRSDLVDEDQVQQPVDDRLLLQLADVCYRASQLAKTDLLCSYLIDRGMSVPELLHLHQGVRSHFCREPMTTGQSAPADKFLVIKSWGCGYWSDIDNLLGNLLLAEITDRIPVIDWATSSLFHGEGCPDSFAAFWEPINGYRVEDFIPGQHSCFPPKWSMKNLCLGEVNKYQGGYSRMAWQHYLDCEEDLVVSDFFVAVNDLLPWLPSNHWLSGFDPEQAYRKLFIRYLKLRPEIAAEIDLFWSETMGNGPIVAVHVRGSDKYTEDPNLSTLNQLYRPAITKALDDLPAARIFLMTDTEQTVAEFRAIYGERPIVPHSFRTSSQVGVHFHPSADRKRLVTEVIRDVFVAVRCNYFIGNGLSNVSAAVSYIKEWPLGSCRLLGASSTRMRRLTYYNELAEQQVMN